MGVAVDDAGRGREQGGRAVQGRFERLRLAGRERLQVVHAIGGGAGGDAFEAGGFVVRGGDDELAQTLVADAARRAVLIEQVLAAHAQAGLQAAGRIVDAGMDDFGVARAGAGADGFGGFGHQHFAARQGQGAGDGQADDAGADDDAIDIRIHGVQVWRAGVRSNPPA